MAKFVIEGTVSELEITGKECTFKFHGAEGYSTKLGEKQYNVLFPKDGERKLKKAIPLSAYIIPTEREYKVSEKQSHLLVTALSEGKKVRIVVNEQDNKIENKDKNLHIDSLSLLAD